jgi:co-chaperonin GroES (HSP10)
VDNRIPEARVNKRLPIDSDLSFSSLQWAIHILSEAPLELVVSPEDAGIRFSDIAIRVDPAMPRYAWRVEGANGSVLLVKPITPKPATSAGGLIQIADVYHEPETSGVIVAMAERFACPDCGAARQSELTIGDLVVFAPSTGEEIEWQRERYLLVAEHAVLAVLSEAIA